MRLPKYLVAATGTVLVAIVYSRLVEGESDIGVTWYKVAAPISILVITTAVQFWALGFEAVAFTTRLRVNLELWAIAGLSLVLYYLLSRRGLVDAAWQNPAIALRILAMLCPLLVGTACATTLIGWFVATVKARF